jgi:hypothetical protein
VPMADAVARLSAGLRDADVGVRYWAATGFVVRGGKASADHREELTAALKDSSPLVQIAAAEALATTDDAKDLDAVLPALIGNADITKSGLHAALAAVAAIDRLGKRAVPLKDAIAALPTSSPEVYPSMQEIVLRIVEHIDGTLGIERDKSTRPAARANRQRQRQQQRQNADGKVPTPPADEK